MWLCFSSSISRLLFTCGSLRCWSCCCTLAVFNAWSGSHTFSWGAQASYCGGFWCCPQAVESGLNTRGMPTYLTHTCGIFSQTINQTCASALTSGFLTPGPPGKSISSLTLFVIFRSLSWYSELGCLSLKGECGVKNGFLWGSVEMPWLGQWNWRQINKEKVNQKVLKYVWHPN